MKRAWYALWPSGLFALILGCATSDPTAARCRDIPQGGCPDDGLACTDVSCAALYSCNSDGTWSFVSTCPTVDGGGAGSNAGDARTEDVGAAWDVAWIDAPPGSNGGPGCIDLQPPDCTL